MIDRITSKDNSLLRDARAVRDGKIEEMIFVEGLRLCEEAVNSRLPIQALVYSEELAKKPKPAELIEKFSLTSQRVAAVSEKLLSDQWSIFMFGDNRQK